jgi:hypothetical protein
MMPPSPAFGKHRPQQIRQCNPLLGQPAILENENKEYGQRHFFTKPL